MPSPEEILKQRKAAGLTQAQAGELVGSNVKSWQRWEYGKTVMHAGLWELFLLKSKKLRRSGV